MRAHTSQQMIPGNHTNMSLLQWLTGPNTSTQKRQVICENDTSKSSDSSTTSIADETTTPPAKKHKVERKSVMQIGLRSSTG